MPEEIEEYEEIELGLEDFILKGFKKGKVLRNIDIENEAVEAVHYEIKHLRELAKKIDKLYANPKSSKRDFLNVIRKQREKRDDEIADFIDNIDREQDLFKVIEKKQKNGEITIKLKKVDDKDRIKLIKSIAKKINSKLTEKQREEMIQEQLKRDININETDRLKKIDKELDKKDPKLESHRGCYKLVVGDEDVLMVR